MDRGFGDAFELFIPIGEEGELGSRQGIGPGQVTSVSCEKGRCQYSARKSS